MLVNAPLFPFDVRSVHVLFVSILSAKLPAPSIFIASRFNARLCRMIPLLPPLLEDELDELLLEDV